MPMKTTEKTSPSNNKFFGQEQLSLISEQCVERLEELLTVLGVELRRERRMFVGCCPIHGGDRNNALNIFHSGDSLTGNWKCRSHGCENTFQPTLIGFVRGVLSHNNLDWEMPRDKTYSFQATVSFLLDFLDRKYDDLQVNYEQIEKKRSGDYTTRFYARKQSVKNKILRSVVQKHVVTPDYYVERGYSREILSKYDVTYCDRGDKPMYGRCVAPIYDDDHKFMVGCTGRSIYERCEDCKSYHDPTRPCPLSDDQWKYSKWKHSYGFSAEEWLYNYWYARNHILQTKCAVLVESPGNVWRLEEAGIHTSLGLFGTSLTPGQLDALNRCGAMNILIALDNDDAGELAIDPMIETLSKLYNIDVLEIDGDIGEMPIEVLKRDVVPKIEGAYLQ